MFKRDIANNAATPPKSDRSSGFDDADACARLLCARDELAGELNLVGRPGPDGAEVSAVTSPATESVMFCTGFRRPGVPPINSSST